MELHHINPYIRPVAVYAGVRTEFVGQMVKPPLEGSESHMLFQQETRAILDGLEERNGTRRQVGGRGRP